MDIVNISIGGHTPWRDRAAPYDYTQLIGKTISIGGAETKLTSAATHIITNPPNAWNFSPDGWAAYEAIYGAEAAAKAKQTGYVAENTDPACVYGTQANTLEKALALKAAGKIFGYDQKAIEPTDHTGMVYKMTLFGWTWVPSDASLPGVLRQQDLDNIRYIIREELQAAFPEAF